MAIRGILLDKDGTLIDCDLTWAPVLRRLAEELAPPGSADDLVEAAGLDLATCRLRAGSVWAAGSTADLVRLWWPLAEGDDVRVLRQRIDAICTEMSPHSSVPLIELAAFFDALLARGLVAGIATNDSAASCRAFLKAQGLEARDLHVVGYDSVEVPKPGPDMVHAFCRAAALQPCEVAVVGDNIHDMEMARAAGARVAIGVLSGNANRVDLEQVADVILDSLEDLGGWLDGPAKEFETEKPCSTTRSRTGTG